MKKFLKSIIGQALLATAAFYVVGEIIELLLLWVPEWTQRKFQMLFYSLFFPAGILAVAFGGKDSPHTFYLLWFFVFTELVVILWLFDLYKSKVLKKKN